MDNKVEVMNNDWEILKLQESINEGQFSKREWNRVCGLEREWKNWWRRWSESCSPDLSWAIG